VQVRTFHSIWLLGRFPPSSLLQFGREVHLYTLKLNPKPEGPTASSDSLDAAILMAKRSSPSCAYAASLSLCMQLELVGMGRSCKQQIYGTLKIMLSNWG
jgi:hypothetical protein